MRKAKSKLIIFIGVLTILLICQLRKKIGLAKSSKGVVKMKKAKQEMCTSINPTDTIFISIASYRDPDCHYTVFDCLEKAACPLRIFVGVCEQNYEQDIGCLSGYSKLSKYGTGNYINQIRMLSMDASEAKGPMYARSLIEQKLYGGEKYYMVVDSHTSFYPHWDTHLIDVLQLCPSAKPIITTYAPNFTSYDTMRYIDNAISGHTETTKLPPNYMKFKHFSKNTLLPEFEGVPGVHVLSRPVRSAFWGGCFSFSRAERLREVPFDPFYPYVFSGEEIGMSLRLYTHGWDFFVPTFSVVFHKWTRARPTFWEQFIGTGAVHEGRQREEKQSYRRLRNLFKIEAAKPNDYTLGIYGLGRERSLAMYEQYCGLNFLLQFVAPHAKSGLTQGADEAERFAKHT